MKQAKQELPKQPKAATWAQVRQVLDNPSLPLPLFAAITLAWHSAQRTGDIAEKSLRRSLAFFALDLEAMAVAGADRLSQLTTHAGSRALVNSLPSTLPEITLRARRLA